MVVVAIFLGSMAVALVKLDSFCLIVGGVYGVSVDRKSEGSSFTIGNLLIDI